jgi:ligand-binding sensor domain-containing protein
MKKIFYTTAILILIFSNSTLAQQQGFWKTFTSADGLVNNVVSAIEESGDGTLWFGTSGGGVSRYRDGIFDAAFTTANGLANDSVRAILESSDGALWFGTSGGVSRYQNDIWTTFTTADGLANNNISAIVESRDGALWFATLAGGVSRYQNGIWTTFTTADGLADTNVSAIEESSDGALWFGTDQGACRYQNGIWTTFTIADGLADNNVSAIEASSNGTLWFGTLGRGASRYRDGIFDTTFTAAIGLASDSIRAILQSSDGVLWFGTSGGVSRYQDGMWTIFTMADDRLANNDVRAILESSNEALWFATHEGVSRYQESIWTTHTTVGCQTCIAHNYVFAIEESGDGALWFGTYGGVSRYHNGAFDLPFVTNNSLANIVVAIEEAGNDTLWFGTYGGGVSRYQDGIFDIIFTTANGLTNGDVRAIKASRDGALWFGTYGGGVNRYRDGIFDTLTTAENLANDYVLAIEESGDGALWFGTYGGGVSRFRNGNFDTTFTTANGLANDTVLAIEESGDGALWFGTYGGVSRFRDGIFDTTFTPANSRLADNIVFSIEASRDGAMWFGTYGGVSRYQDGIWTTFSQAEGLNDVRAILESSNGAFWFGTQGGGARRLKPDRSPPVTIITEGPEEITGTPTPLFVVSGRDSRTPQDQLVYSYAVVEASRLPDSRDWEPFTDRTAIQTDFLENGRHRFYVRARDAWRNIDPTPATRTFTVDITQPTVIVNSPVTGEIVAGKVVITGSAFDASPRHDFKNYQLRYAFGADRENLTKSDWKDDRFSGIQSHETRNDTLGKWDTRDLPNGPYWLQLSASDSLDHHSHDYVKVEVVRESQTIDSRVGANFLVETGDLEIYIPPNAIPKDMLLHIRECPISGIIPKEDPQVTFVNLCFEITPSNLRLQKSATLTLHYPDSAIINKNEQKLALYYSADGKGDWQRLGGSVNPMQNKITASFKQLGVFALYEDSTIGSEAGILNVTSQPRIIFPQSNGHNTKTAISFELGREAEVTIKIYNLAGRLVRVLKENEFMRHGINVAYWDGKDAAGQVCVTGLHIVTIQAENKMATQTVMVLNK